MCVNVSQSQQQLQCILFINIIKLSHIHMITSISSLIFDQRQTVLFPSPLSGSVPFNTKHICLKRSYTEYRRHYQTYSSASGILQLARTV